jgi:hypothetical protein
MATPLLPMVFSSMQLLASYQ